MKIPRISWPTAAVIVATFAAMLGFYALSKGEDRTEAILLIGAIGTTVAGILRSLLTPPAPPAPPARPSDQDGPPTRPRRPMRADTTPTIPRIAVLVVPGALRAFSQQITRFAHSIRPISGPTLFVAVLALSGCGASALSTHATIAVGLEASLGVSRGLIAPACDVSLTACHGDQACIDGVARDCRSAVAAWEVGHAAVLGYVEALQAASLADEGSVLDALAMVLATTARTWAATVAALATVGVTLPSIPDAAAPLLAAIGGSS